MVSVFLGLRAAHLLGHQALSSDHTSAGRQRTKSLAPRAEAAQATNGAAVAVRQQLQLKVAAKVIPHPDKASYGGEDAHFVSYIDGGALGVADGVGGWNESGISPAEYSRTFMETACKFLEGELDEQQYSSSAASTTDWMESRPAWDGVASSDGEESTSGEDAVAGEAGVAKLVQLQQGQAPSSNGAQQHSAEQQQQRQRVRHRTPLQALDIAHRLTRLPGSATACIMRLDSERGVLNAANLGDSGFLLLRGGKLLFQSPALQHFFDCPYQFGACPEHTEATDSVEDAEVYDFNVQPGDVVILATDGLLDNCYTHEILELAPKSSAHVAEAAAALAELASKHAADPEFESPYTEEAAQEGFDIPIWEKVMNASFKDGKLQLGKLRGGKIDDITVLVGYVEAMNSS